MSPRALDPAIRRAVTEAAIRILGTEGRSALTTRRLAREANTSTTAVYTYFGSMDDVHRHVRRQAIGALLAALDVVGITDDPWPTSPAPLRSRSIRATFTPRCTASCSSTSRRTTPPTPPQRCSNASRTSSSAASARGGSA